MPVYICAISTQDRDPSAYALVEQAPEVGSARPVYTVKELGRFDGVDPIEHIGDLLSEYTEAVGNSILVTTGGLRVARKFDDAGMSVVPVDTRRGQTQDGSVILVPEQTLVDTFEAVFRDASVNVPAEEPLISDALAALYTVMSDEAGAGDAPEGLYGEEDEPVDETGPARIDQTGTSEAVSTARVGGNQRTRDMDVLSEDVEDVEPRGRVEDSDYAFEELPLGDKRDISLALALAVWYGEFTADELPTTGQAADTRRVRNARRSRQDAARRAAR